MTGGENRAEFRPFLQSNQNNVKDEGDQNKNHDLSESPAKDLFYACGHGILTKIRINYHRVQVKAVFQTHQNRTEVIDQTAGTDGENKVPDDRFDRTTQHVIPRLFQQDITEQNDQTNKVSGLGNDVIDDEGPNCV